MTSLLRPLLASVLLLLAAGARAEDALPAWLSVPTRACTEGAVTAKCRCGTAKVTSGYCCSGVAQAYSCPLLTEPAGTFSHVYFGASAIHDTKGLPWSMTGTVPQIAASGLMPAGGGPCSSGNYYGLAAVDKGGWSVTGDHWTCALFKQTSVAAYGALVTNGAYYGLDYPTSGHVVAQFTGGVATTKSGFMVGGGLNVACWGQAGTKGRVTINGDAFAESNVSAVVSPTTDVVYLCKGFAPLVGSLHEVLAVAGTPTEAVWRPYVFAGLRANGNKLMLVTGDSIAYGTGASRPYGALLADALNDGWVVTNRAVGGVPVSANRTDWDSYIEGGPWKILIIEGGYNDVGGGRTSDQLLGDYTYMMDRARANGMKVIIVGFLPFGRNSVWTQAKEDLRTAVNSGLDTYAAAHPDEVAVIDRASITEGGVNIPIAWDWSDGVHWNQTGHASGLEPAIYAAGHGKGWF